MKLIKPIRKVSLRASAALVVAAAVSPTVVADSASVENPENGHLYQRFDRSMGWHDAQGNCEAVGGHLVTITSQQENEFVFDTFVNAPDHAGIFVWIGATDEQIEGDWRWVTGEPWGFEAWYPGEPNNTANLEDHAEMGRHRLFAERSWNDYRSTSGGGCAPAWSCTSIDSMASICEWEVQSGYAALTTLPDINGNDTPELAALGTLSDGIPQVVIKDSDTKELINVITFGVSAKTPTGITSLLDINGNGSPEVAVLLVKPNGTGRVVVRDAKTGARVGAMSFFGKNWEAKAITSQDLDGDGVSEISVLAEKDDGTEIVIQLKDSITGDEMNWIELPVN